MTANRSFRTPHPKCCQTWKPGATNRLYTVVVESIYCAEYFACRKSYDVSQQTLKYNVVFVNFLRVRCIESIGMRVGRLSKVTTSENYICDLDLVLHNVRRQVRQPCREIDDLWHPGLNDMKVSLPVATLASNASGSCSIHRHNM